MVLDVHGVGYEISIPLSTFEKINSAQNPVTLITHLHVREDTLQLFGFATSNEKALFQKLIAVSGIGPKVALGILSSTSVDDFKLFIRTGDVLRLKAMPGIGKKTAERLILELKDKFEGVRGADDSAAAPAASHVLDQAAMALISLGYSRANVEKTLRQIAENGGAEDVETLIKTALRQL
jgi:Holliday junction DNA helicase RuvA